MENFYNDFETFSKQYQKEEKEILILTNGGGGASMFGNSWNSIKYFLAYFDIASNELRNDKGRVNWFISAEDRNQHGCCYPYYLKDCVIYHLKVRELINKSITEGALPSFYNSFLVVSVIMSTMMNCLLY